MAISIVMVILIAPSIVNACVILLQTSPQKMKGALSKCMREASTIDGVLECQQFNVWSVGFGLGTRVNYLIMFMFRHIGWYIACSCQGRCQ